MTVRASEPHKLCIACRHFIADGVRCGKRPGHPKANMARLNPQVCGPKAKLFEAKL